MLHLLELEWKKQKDFMLFRVLTIAYLVLLPAMLLVGKTIPVDQNAPFNPQKMFFQFPSVWEWLGYVGNWLVFFGFGFLSVLLVTNEHSNKTLRQNVITGLHRSEFFWSKVVFILAISLFATIYYTLWSLIYGFWHTETIYLSTIFKNWDLIPRYFLMSAGYMSFGLLLGVLVKRTGIALFIYLAYAFFLEPVIRWALHLRLLKHKSMNFYPLNAMEDLCPLPFSEQADFFSKQYKFDLYLSPMEAVIASCVYIALFFWWSRRRLMRSDL